jgi:hypothetical protein
MMWVLMARDHRQPVLELRLPQLFAPLGEVVASPDVVDEDVELSDLFEEPRDLLGDGVVHLHGDAAAAALRDDGRGLVDRLGTVLHAGAAGDAAAGAVDGRPQLA